MIGNLYTVAEAAERLKLHVKTVLGFIRDGRLKASRIGKQYRITQTDLDAFTGESPSLVEVSRRRRIEVSSIVEVDAIGPESVTRTVAHLQGALKGRTPDDHHAQLDTIYYPEIGRLKLIISASPETTAKLLNYVPILLAD